MGSKQPEISDNDSLDWIKIILWYRGRPYGLRIRIGSDVPTSRKALQQTRTCAHCGAKLKGAKIGRRTIEAVWHEIEDADGQPRLDAANRFGKVLINQALKRCRTWLCQDLDTGCEFTRFELD